MGVGFRELVRRYAGSVSETRRLGEEVCGELVNILKHFVPDIQCSVGWEEGGVDTIVLFSRSRSVSSLGFDVVRREDVVPLEDVVMGVVEELRGRVCAPYGVYVTGEEARRIRDLLARVVR